MTGIDNAAPFLIYCCLRHHHRKSLLFETRAETEQTQHRRSLLPPAGFPENPLTPFTNGLFCFSDFIILETVFAEKRFKANEIWALSEFLNYSSLVD